MTENRYREAPKIVLGTMDGEPDTTRSRTFLTTLPGMLTAAAGVVTAIGGLYLGFKSGSPERLHVEPPPQEDVDPATLNVEELNEIDPGDLGNEFDRTIEDCANGSTDACIVLLDQLTVECAEGYGLSCDWLYLVSPVGSDHEWFGSTCGGRFAEPYDGYCADL
jgi:hypothetical protein